MPEAIIWELTFGCGHPGEVDLSALPAAGRPRRAAFLTGKGLCSDCFDKTCDHPRRSRAIAGYLAGTDRCAAQVRG